MEVEKDIKVCKNCVMDTTDSSIIFDENGVCDYCNNYYNDLLKDWNPKVDRTEELLEISDKIRRENKGKEFDCIIGMSGGVDSSYLAYVAKEIMGLRPLLYAVDTGWNLEVANKNIEAMVKALDLPLYIEKVDWNEMRDLQIAFLKSQVPYQDFPQDHAIFAGLYNFAVKNKIKYVLTGANNATEGVRPPVEWVYFNDIKLMRDIHKRFGTLKLKTFPQCGMFKYRIYYRYFKGMKRVAPLDYIIYNKEEAEKELHEKFGWNGYANKHYENIFTRFYEGYYLREKFGYDKRKCYLSNLILTGELSRDEALEILKQDPYPRETMNEDMEYIATKLELSIDEFKKILKGVNKTYKDYKNSYNLISCAIKIAQKFGIENRNFR